MNVCVQIMNNMKMLYYDRIGVSGEINVNETREAKECKICHYWNFLDKGFKFQSYVSNRCYDLVVISMNLSDIAI